MGAPSVPRLPGASAGTAPVAPRIPLEALGRSFRWAAGTPAMPPSPPPPERPDCSTCRHHWITWDESAPRGCLAYGFKTRGLPARYVALVSGEPCRLFERREREEIGSQP